MIGASKLDENKVEIIRDLLVMGVTHQQIADMFGVSREHITAISNGRRWNDETKSFRMKSSNDFRDFTDKPQGNTDTETALKLLVEDYLGCKIKKVVVEF